MVNLFTRDLSIQIQGQPNNWVTFEMKLVVSENSRVLQTLSRNMEKFSSKDDSFLYAEFNPPVEYMNKKYSHLYFKSIQFDPNARSIILNPFGTFFFEKVIKTNRQIVNLQIPRKYIFELDLIFVLIV